MNETERIELIKKRLGGNEYFINPHADVSAKEDLEFLISLLQMKEEKIALLEKKAQILGQQVAELNAEIENVKSDFGNMR